MKFGYCSGKESGSLFYSNKVGVKICWKCDDINQKPKECLTCLEEFTPRCGSRFVCEECYRSNARKLDVVSYSPDLSRI